MKMEQKVSSHINTQVNVKHDFKSSHDLLLKILQYNVYNLNNLLASLMYVHSLFKVFMLLNIKSLYNLTI